MIYGKENVKSNERIEVRGKVVMKSNGFKTFAKYVIGNQPVVRNDLAISIDFHERSLSGFLGLGVDKLVDWIKPK